jgi:hypothetical protein
VSVRDRLSPAREDEGEERMVDEATPAMQNVRAIDVRPYEWGIWCTVEGSPKPFTNVIEMRKWSEDGQSIWFMLGTHNFHNAKPDDILTLVPLSEAVKRYVTLETDAEQDAFVRSRPTPAKTCEHCGGSGKAELFRAARALGPLPAPTRDDIMATANRVVRVILDDINSRSGLENAWYEIDPDIQRQVLSEWQRLVMRELGSA